MVRLHEHVFDRLFLQIGWVIDQDDRVYRTEPLSSIARWPDRLLAEVFGQRRPALVSASGEQLELPQPVFDMLIQVLRSIRERRAIVLLPEDEAFTTQAAAEYLGMSRPFLIGLLEKGEIPFHYVGSHRRVLFRDLMNYENTRDAARREGMKNLFNKVQGAGLDEAGYIGE